jgi:hypothetical protein
MQRAAAVLIGSVRRMQLGKRERAKRAKVKAELGAAVLIASVRRMQLGKRELAKREAVRSHTYTLLHTAYCILHIYTHTHTHTHTPTAGACCGGH